MSAAGCPTDSAGLVPSLQLKALPYSVWAGSVKPVEDDVTDPGGRNLVGPNLWGVVGRPRASEPGFNYSAAMKSKGGNWTIEDLNQFITNPRGTIPGTNMTWTA